MSLRIIGGTCKGKALVSPVGRRVRPTAGRVREALFAILAPELAGAVVLDLFAGSGALGLEALSRGAGGAVFVDTEPASLAAIKKNVAACGFQALARVMAQDATGDLRSLRPAASDGEVLSLPFTLVFLDPPYRQGLTVPALEALAGGGILAAEATIVAEHYRREPLAEKDCLRLGLRLRDCRKYGKSLVSIMRYGVN